ncbi:MAG: hypothetical protein K0S74_1382 [Chlamydiales bacterium]|jgi:hypothetical protein|nr:hypothetical protein [Chlamydiales bacterium]
MVSGIFNDPSNNIGGSRGYEPTLKELVDEIKKTKGFETTSEFNLKNVEAGKKIYNNIINDRPMIDNPFSGEVYHTKESVRNLYLYTQTNSRIGKSIANNFKIVRDTLV